jgi:organic radical activating enzyme
VKYSVAEIFTAPQGEGVYTGALMTFIRFVGCSVGKKTCHFCDTDFDKTYPWLGGGEFTVEGLENEVRAQHVCFTGGEPFDQNIGPLLAGFKGPMIHFETSGTKPIPFKHSEIYERPRKIYTDATVAERKVWISMCPKPGWIEANTHLADEIKVIVPGLGTGDGWPTVDHARNWALSGRPVFLQPRNKKNEIDRRNLDLCLELQHKYPELRVSAQMHKFLTTR